MVCIAARRWASLTSRTRRAGPSVRPSAQGGQPGDQVEHLSAQALLGAQAAVGGGLGEPDQGHETAESAAG